MELNEGYYGYIKVKRLHFVDYNNKLYYINNLDEIIDYDSLYQYEHLCKIDIILVMYNIEFLYNILLNTFDKIINLYELNDDFTINICYNEYNHEYNIYYSNDIKKGTSIQIIELLDLTEHSMNRIFDLIYENYINHRYSKNKLTEQFLEKEYYMFIEHFEEGINENYFDYYYEKDVYLKIKNIYESGRL